ncbi:FKBP-type peptidyl-prolyl cis-trans isomerase [Escherichia coli]|uniref:FKBP-type peptidyl-prolyl cis-trans isomerase N-terminal domain-containing protein n=1 Tax=Escherichia coli TaxID=562 RepID=UPI001F2E8FB4|nr:FKBP-type peptidyl-prolyl cis-trans isomerase N-terminal domain-containing protein [Escherichia coli]MCE9975905.1 FKBP-type peptidyl-prolyl cis-trans isomerase [Escherichia coli]MCE9989530.1 FKBP-type peptidyl-prolyl cis-trans isomerase [Escherichia coli]
MLTVKIHSLKRIVFVSLFLLSCIAGLLFFLTGAARAAEEEGLPGILRYAREQEMKQADGNKQPQAAEPERTYVTGTELKRRLTRSETELRQLRKENRQLRGQLKQASGVDGSREVADLKKRLQEQDVAHKKTLGELTEKAENARNQLAQEVVALKQQLAEWERTEKEKAGEGQKLAETQAKLAVSEKENEGLKSSLDELKVKMAQMPVVDTEQLSTPEKQQTYAAGVMMGRDILSLQAANALSGIKTDNRVLLAGVRDALNRQELLNENVLQTALSQAEQSISKARLETAARWKKAGAAWLETFKKQKGVQKDSSGFWYRVEHAGDGELISGDDTVVDVVVVEKLTDGTVIEDMDARGTVISQPLGEYPPVFRSALLLLKNHGTVTVAAPPELAYGDEGYPPKVPPGATMVYTIRVEDVKEGNASQDEQKDRNAVASEKTKGAKKS